METVCPSCKNKFKLFEIHASKPKTTILCPFCRQKIMVGKTVKPNISSLPWQNR